ncbi:MAG: transcriptional regulator BetI [Pseudomonadota bacterium]
MPKIGMEPIRRDALVKATIAEVGARGSLDVTVRDIARRAGVSSALAHHYFGGKEQIFLAAMRQILSEFGGIARRELAGARGPRGRVDAIVAASFDPACFAPPVIRAWMTFYARAQDEAGTRRLLQIYQLRMRSNLAYGFRGLVASPRQAAEIVAAAIDGVYLRAAVSGTGGPQELSALINALVGAER